MGRNLDVLLLYKGHSDLGFVGFAQLLDLFLFFYATFDDNTCSITSNNLMADDVNTILFMVCLNFLLKLRLCGLKCSLQMAGPRILQNEHPS